MGNTTATPKKSKHNSNNNDDDDDDQQRQQEQPGPNERNRQSSDPPPRATSSPPRSPDWSRTSSIDSGSSSRRRSVSSADGLKAARDLNESDGFDPNDPLGGFDADEALASENVEHPEQWEPHRLEELRAALRKKIQSLGPEDAVSVKSLRLEQADAFQMPFASSAWKTWFKAAAHSIMEDIDSEEQASAANNGGGDRSRSNSESSEPKAAASNTIDLVATDEVDYGCFGPNDSALEPGECSEQQVRSLRGFLQMQLEALGPDDGMSMKKLRVDQGDAFGRDFKTPAWKAWIKDTAVQIMDLLEELAAAGAEGSPIASDDGGGFATPPPADAEDVGWDTPGHSSSGEGSGNLAPARHDPVPIRTTSLPDGNGSEAESFAPDTTSDDTEGDDDLSHGSLYVGDKVMADFRGEGQWYGGEIDAVDEAAGTFSIYYDDSDFEEDVPRDRIMTKAGWDRRKERDDAREVRRAAREKKKKARETQRKKAARDENAFSKDASLERDDALEHSFRSRVDTPTLPSGVQTPRLSAKYSNGAINGEPTVATDAADNLAAEAASSALLEQQRLKRLAELKLEEEKREQETLSRERQRQTALAEQRKAARVQEILEERRAEKVNLEARMDIAAADARRVAEREPSQQRTTVADCQPLASKGDESQRAGSNIRNDLETTQLKQAQIRQSIAERRQAAESRDRPKEKASLAAALDEDDVTPSPVARMTATLARYSARYEEKAKVSSQFDGSSTGDPPDTQAEAKASQDGHVEHESDSRQIGLRAEYAPAPSDSDDDWSLPSGKEHTSSNVRVPVPNTLNSQENEDSFGHGAGRAAQSTNHSTENEKALVQAPPRPSHQLSANGNVTHLVAKGHTQRSNQNFDNNDRRMQGWARVWPLKASGESPRGSGIYADSELATRFLVLDPNSCTLQYFATQSRLQGAELRLSITDDSSLSVRGKDGLIFSSSLPSKAGGDSLFGVMAHFESGRERDSWLRAISRVLENITSAQTTIGVGGGSSAAPRRPRSTHRSEEALAIAEADRNAEDDHTPNAQLPRIGRSGTFGKPVATFRGHQSSGSANFNQASPPSFAEHKASSSPVEERTPPLSRSQSPALDPHSASPEEHGPEDIDSQELFHDHTGGFENYSGRGDEPDGPQQEKFPQFVSSNTDGPSARQRFEEFDRAQASEMERMNSIAKAQQDAELRAEQEHAQARLQAVVQFVEETRQRRKERRADEKIAKAYYKRRARSYIARQRQRSHAAGGRDSGMHDEDILSDTSEESPEKEFRRKKCRPFASKGGAHQRPTAQNEGQTTLNEKLATDAAFSQHLEDTIRKTLTTILSPSDTGNIVSQNSAKRSPEEAAKRSAARRGREIVEPHSLALQQLTQAREPIDKIKSEPVKPLAGGDSETPIGHKDAGDDRKRSHKKSKRKKRTSSKKRRHNRKRRPELSGDNPNGKKNGTSGKHSKANALAQTNAAVTESLGAVRGVLQFERRRHKRESRRQRRNVERAMDDKISALLNVIEAESSQAHRKLQVAEAALHRNLSAKLSKTVRRFEVKLRKRDSKAKDARRHLEHVEQAMQRRLSVQISTLMDAIQAQQEAALAEQDDVNETLQLYRRQLARVEKAVESSISDRLEQMMALLGGAHPRVDDRFELPKKPSRDPASPSSPSSVSSESLEIPRKPRERLYQQRFSPAFEIQRKVRPKNRNGQSNAAAELDWRTGTINGRAYYYRVDRPSDVHWDKPPLQHFDHNFPDDSRMVTKSPPKTNLDPVVSPGQFRNSRASIPFASQSVIPSYAPSTHHGEQGRNAHVVRRGHNKRRVPELGPESPSERSNINVQGGIPSTNVPGGELSPLYHSNVVLGSNFRDHVQQHKSHGLRVDQSYQYHHHTGQRSPPPPRQRIVEHRTDTLLGDSPLLSARQSPLEKHVEWQIHEGRRPMPGPQLGQRSSRTPSPASKARTTIEQSPLSLTLGRGQSPPQEQSTFLNHPHLVNAQRQLQFGASTSFHDPGTVSNGDLSEKEPLATGQERDLRELRTHNDSLVREEVYHARSHQGRSNGISGVDAVNRLVKNGAYAGASGAKGPRREISGSPYVRASATASMAMLESDLELTRSPHRRYEY